MDRLVSVIVPIYHGERFIDNIIKMTEDCVRVAGLENKAELILSFDDPIEDIREYYSDILFIIVLKTDKNRGVHGARVRGLEKSSGKYVVFLDQDDLIFPDYLKSQLERIGTNDAVVCGLLNGGKATYTDDNRLEDVITKKWMFTKWNPIVSPGQVLIKRASIPKLWKDRILNIPGADDYYLWICMFGMNLSFALNREILFEHVLHPLNESLDAAKILGSVKEMFAILKEEDILSLEDKGRLDGLYESLACITVKRLGTYKTSYFIMNKLLELEKNRKVSVYLKEKNYKIIAIYGAGEIGRQFYSFLKLVFDGKIIFIDKNAKTIGMNEPVYEISDALNETDLIIISLPGMEDVIRKDLSSRFTCEIRSISGLINLIDETA